MDYLNSPFLMWFNLHYIFNIINHKELNKLILNERTTMQKHYIISTQNKTPQNKKISGRKKDMTKNAAGGYSFKIDCWSQLNRFLILGSTGGTFYVNELKLTEKNIKVLDDCLKKDGKRVVDTILDISINGKSVKVDQQIFAMAYVSAKGDLNTKRYALYRLSLVCRTASHLFMFMEYSKSLRGFGRSIKRAVQLWYLDKDIDELAYQVVKYRNRNGWTHADVLRKSKPVTDEELRNNVFAYAVGKVNIGENDSFRRILTNSKSKSKEMSAPVNLPEIIVGFEKAKNAKNAKQLTNLIVDYNLTHEMIPNEFKQFPEVWEALLQKMPLTAMIRNLNKMTSVGILDDFSKSSKLVCERITDADFLRKSRVHPITLLSALKVYSNGSGVKGSLSWRPVRKIRDSLDEAFYLAFKNVEPTNKNIMLSLDVSGSMYNAPVLGFDFMRASDVSAAMALVTANVEENYTIMGFGGSFEPLSISPKQRLENVLKYMRSKNFGRTDCSLPIVYAKKNKWEIDAFFIYTDNETWCGNSHPSEELKTYRKSFVKDSKLCVIATSAVNYSIADPDDPGMLDVVGFSSDTPKILSDFVLGKI